MTGEGNVQVSGLVREKVCIGCALCAEICPHDAITMTDPIMAKNEITAGTLSPWYIRNPGPDNYPKPVVKAPVAPPKPVMVGAT